MPLIFPLLGSVCLLISFCFNEQLFVPFAISSILSKCDKKEPSLLVKALIIVDTCPKNLTCAISMPLVVVRVASLEQ